MADDAAPTREVLCLAGKCFEPTINVLFQGITNGSQAIPSLDVKLEDSTQVKALALVQKAAEARFLRELTPVELTDVVIYATAAPALMGKKKITGEELCVCTEFEDEEPAGPLWIIVEIINAVIARARASAADQLRTSSTGRSKPRPASATSLFPTPNLQLSWARSAACSRRPSSAPRSSTQRRTASLSYSSRRESQSTAATLRSSNVTLRQCGVLQRWYAQHPF